MGIEFKNLSKAYRETRALDNVSFSLEPGHIYGLLGNNGAGKSTLLNILTNRIFPDSGTVTVDGKSVFGNDEALGMMFLMSEQNLYPDETRVEKAFTIASRFYPRFDRRYAHTLAEQFGLNTRKKITSLSTGYASIFRLITALSVNVPYLLLDEPVLGLDAGHRDLFYRLLIEKFAESPCTVLLSTHLIQEVADIIEHVIIIHDGRILRDQPCDQLLADAYTVTGPAGLVDTYAANRKLLSSNTLGGLKTVCLQGKKDALPDGLEAGSMKLQDYFIQLIRGEDVK